MSLPNFANSAVTLSLLPLLIFTTGCEKDPHPEYRQRCNDASGKLTKVLFIGIDGCRSDALQAADTPAIDSLRNIGTYSFYVDRGTHTVSVPGWSTLLHGVFPEKHGCINNAFEGCDYKSYPDLFHYIKSSNPALNLFTLSHWDNFLKITTNEDYAMEYESDEALKEAALDVLKNCHPDVLLLHFDAPDSAGHEHGFHPDTVQYLKSIERTDQFISEIIAETANREQLLDEQWLTIICTDHGGEGTSHGGQDDFPQTRYVFLIISPTDSVREITAPVTNTDVLPSILKYLDIEIKNEWNLDGEPLF